MAELGKWNCSLPEWRKLGNLLAGGTGEWRSCSTAEKNCGAVPRRKLEKLEQLQKGLHQKGLPTLLANSRMCDRPCDGEFSTSLTARTAAFRYSTKNMLEVMRHVKYFATALLRQNLRNLWLATTAPVVLVGVRRRLHAEERRMRAYTMEQLPKMRMRVAMRKIRILHEGPSGR